MEEPIWVLAARPLREGMNTAMVAHERIICKEDT